MQSMNCGCWVVLVLVGLAVLGTIGGVVCTSNKGTSTRDVQPRVATNTNEPTPIVVSSARKLVSAPPPAASLTTEERARATAGVAALRQLVRERSVAKLKPVTDTQCEPIQKSAIARQDEAYPSGRARG